MKKKTILLTAVPLNSQYGFSSFNSVGDAIERLFGPAFALAAIAVTVYFVIGATRFIFSGGEKEKIDSARKMIVHSIIGFVMLVVMFTFLKFLFNSLGLQNFNLLP